MLKKLILFLMASYLIVTLIITISAFIMPQNLSNMQPADFLVVHGAGGEGNNLMEPSIERAKTGARAWKQGLAPKIIFTGGRDKPENKAISEMMADIAIELGVPKDAILFETKSQSTIQNLIYAFELDENANKDVILISHGFHLPRCWFTAKVLGAQNTQLLSAGSFYRPIIPNGIYIVTREALAWPVNILRIWGVKYTSPENTLLR